MNQQQQQQPGAGLSPELYEYLVMKVHAPLFFTKLAEDWGVVPQSDEERGALLEMAGLLRNAKAQDEIKSASFPNSPILSALDDLKAGLQADGYVDVPGDSSFDRQVKSAAYHLLAGDPYLQEAAFAWGVFQDQQKQKQQQAQ